MWLAACGDGEAAPKRTDPHAQARGEVVARVAGAPIGSEDVRTLVEATGLAPREALQRLEEAKLAEQYAQARGYGDTPQVEREVQRALVQALLAETVEREVRPATIPLEAVRARFEAVRGAQHIPVEAFAEHEASVRAQLALELREAALARLLDRLRQEHPVQLDEGQVGKALADPTLWGGGT